MSMSVVPTQAATAQASSPAQGVDSQVWVEGLEKSLVARANQGDTIAMEFGPQSLKSVREVMMESDLFWRSYLCYPGGCPENLSLL